MRFYVSALLAIAAISAVPVENPNGSMDNPLPRQKRENIENIELKCEPHVVSKKFCNTCICTSDGKSTTCTKNECPEGGYNEDGTLKPSDDTEKQICEPWSQFKVNCNDCWCGESGHAAICTEDLCKDTTCEPGKVVRNGCEECTCDTSGTQTICISKFCGDKKVVLV